MSDKERKQDYDNVFKDVASVLVDKCVNPHTQRPYTLTMLERALRDVHFNVDLKKSAKQQALEVRGGHLLVEISGWKDWPEHEKRALFTENTCLLPIITNVPNFCFIPSLSAISFSLIATLGGEQGSGVSHRESEGRM